MTPEGTQYRVLVADDHDIVLRGVESILRKSRKFVVTRTCRDGAEALAVMNAGEVDIAILDYQMPGIDGFEILRRLNPAGKKVRTVIFTQYIYLADKARALGANAFVDKTKLADQLIDRLETIVAGQNAFGEIAAQEESTTAETGSLTEADRQAIRETMTDTERLILLHISRGASTKEIASELGLSMRTIEDYRGKIIDILNLRGPTLTLTKWAALHHAAIERHLGQR